MPDTLKVGRPKKYASAAERQRAYRQRNKINTLERLQEWKQNNPHHKIAPEKKKLRNREQRRRKRMNTKFIAFDGEGIDTDIIAGYLKDGQPIYRQLYTLLTASDGNYVENWENGLSTKTCLDFLLNYSGDTYNISFAFGYDTTKMLCDLDESSLRCLWQIGEVNWEEYYIKYIPTKILIIGKGDDRVTIYDTFGFFQKSFIQALQDWKIDVPQEIIEGKQQRNNFRNVNRDQIKDYNYKECVLLVELMNKMRLAMDTCGIVPNQWYGVGAIANTVFDQYGIQYCVDSPVAMIPKFLNAYYGGRNQLLQLGEFKTAWFHDINSAYPHVLSTLPSSIGTWYPAEPQYYNYPWTLYKVSWKIPDKYNIAPFPVRHKGRIYWPLEGTGWYWQPEVTEALKYYKKYIRIEECWAYEPSDEQYKPFEFIIEYYARRQQFIKEGNDAQLVLKLAMNAGYGKLAQSKGKYDKRPKFQNFFLAGYITSSTRAKVFSLAMQNPDSVIGFATDGVITTKKLCEHSPEKTLGAWEVKQVYDYFAIQTGVYTYRGADNNSFFKSRGFSHRSVDYEELRKVWRKSGILARYTYNENRFYGIGKGLSIAFDVVGNWAVTEREIVFYPQTMDYDDSALDNQSNGKNYHLRLKSPRFIGESEGYKMKVNWLHNDGDFDEVDDLDQEM